MYLCKLCGREIPDARSIPFRLKMRAIDSGHTVTSLNDFPDIFWEICDTHLDKFGNWFYRGSIFELRRNAKRMPVTEDMVQWVETQILTLSGRMQKGLPGGYCQCETMGGQCPYWADGYIGEVMACKRHIKQHEKGARITVCRNGKQPITTAAMNLLNL